VADAYLLDHAVAERVVVVASLGHLTPDGNGALMSDPNGPIDFQATGFDWLAITGSSAQFQGVGTINGCGRYLVAGTATQGVAPATDTFEVHIWDASHSFDAPLLLVTGMLSTGQIKIVR